MCTAGHGPLYESPVFLVEMNLLIGRRCAGRLLFTGSQDVIVSEMGSTCHLNLVSLRHIQTLTSGMSYKAVGGEARAGFGECSREHPRVSGNGSRMYVHTGRCET